MSSIRRVYFYLINLISLGIMAAGAQYLLSLLFDLAFERPSSIVQPGFIQQQLSLGVAMLVIGCPLWFFFWRSIQKHTVNNQAEIGSVMRQVYLKLILIVTSLMGLFAAESVFTWLMAGTPEFHPSSGSLATLIVTAAIWFYYWKVSENEGQPSPVARTLRRWYVYFASGWGLAQLSIGIVQIVHAAALVLPVWGQSLVSASFWTEEVQSSISWIILGGVFWAFHWYRMSGRDYDSILRQVYIYLLAITGSSITGLVSLVMGIYYCLVWGFGAVDSGSGYFQFLGWVIPTIIVAASIWLYHRALAQEEAGYQQERRLSSRRVHLYIMSFLGLGTMIAGLVILLGVLLDLLINSLQPSIVVHPGWWQKQVSLFLSLLLVAFPLWWFYWNQVITLSSRGGAVEWKARSRRVYLYVIIGASIIALAADLVNIFYQLLSAGLAGNADVQVLKNMSWSIQSLIVAAPLLAYHWQIARTDQRLGSEMAVGQKNVAILAGRESQYLISRIEEKLGYKVTVMQFSGLETGVPVLTDDDLTLLINNIRTTPEKDVMLVFHEGKILIFPYLHQ